MCAGLSALLRDILFRKAFDGGDLFYVRVPKKPALRSDSRENHASSAEFWENFGKKRYGKEVRKRSPEKKSGKRRVADRLGNNLQMDISVLK